MSKWVHRLKKIDLQKMTAICTNCGAVELMQSPSMKFPQCKSALRERKRIYKDKKRGVVRAESCEICGSTFRICYDHCHKTGDFRGWLCNNCNLMLGYAKDNVDTLEKAIAYLSK